MFCSECGNFAARKAIHQLTEGKNGFVCLPVVELSTTLGTGKAFTAEENAALNAAWDSKMPIVVKCTIASGNDSFDECSLLFSRTIVNGDTKLYAFVTTVMGFRLMIVSLPESIWMFQAEVL